MLTTTLNKTTIQDPEDSAIIPGKADFMCINFAFYGSVMQAYKPHKQ